MHALNICRGLCSISTSKRPANLRFALKCEGGKGRAVIQLHALNVESWSHAKKGDGSSSEGFSPSLSCCPACWPAEGLSDRWSPLGHKTGQKQSGKRFYSEFVSENLRRWNVYVCLFVWEGGVGWKLGDCPLSDPTLGHKRLSGFQSHNIILSICLTFGNILPVVRLLCLI